MFFRYFILILLFLPTASFAAISVDVSGERHRGSVLLLDISADGPAEAFTVAWQEKEISFPARCTPDKGCGAKVLLPVDYELIGNFVLSVKAAGHTPSTTTLAIQDKAYIRQVLSVDPHFVTLSPEALARVEKERPRTLEAIAAFSSARLWDLPLKRPVPGKINSQFGQLRTFNGEPRNKHNGVDFAGQTGDKILAAAAGKVILTGNFYFSGNTVFIDHGQGVVTTYMHMSEISVKTGNMVAAGDLVGLVGATGRVTGPHLHFGLYAQGVGVDPMDLF